MTGARHPFLDRTGPIAFAHRGGSLEAEENTMEAFARAVALGYTHVETDVHATRDGVAVIHHDETLERMTGEAVAIADLTWDDLRTIRTRGGAEIPRADQLLEAFPDLRVNFEAKTYRVARPLAQVIERAGALPRICVGSFEAQITGRMRELLGPDLCWSPARGGVLAVWLSGWGLPIRRPGFHALQVPTHYKGIPIVTPRFIRAAEARGLDVQVWTVDEEAEIEGLLDMGVHGIMTDRPQAMKRVFERRGVWPG